MSSWRDLLAVLCFAFAACSGTTGSALVSFDAVAAGPSDASAPLTFTTGSDAQVTLDRARLHIGAVYLNQSVPLSGAASQPCIAPGVYAAQVFGPLDVDLLSSEPQPFPTRGAGTETLARSAEVWLTGGDINAAEDPTVILEVQGSAVQSGMTFPFHAAVTIGQNRALMISNPALPGANPICHRRIVSAIRIDITPADGGQLVLRVDPRPMFDAIDFTTLSDVQDGVYEIPDTSSGAGGDLYKGLTADYGVYNFSWNAHD